MPQPDLGWLDPAFHLPGTLLAALLVGYLLAGEPLFGRRLYARLTERRDTDPAALLRFYRQTLAAQAAFAGIPVLALVADPGLAADDLGLVWPGGPYRWWATGFAAYLTAVVLGAGLVLRARARRGRRVPGQDAFAAMLPRTPRERRYAGAVALGAGISEELAFRGFLTAAGVGLLGLTPIVSLAAATVVFALAHLYQGLTGVITTLLLGAVFGALFLVSGSLLPAAVVHAAIDLRSLLLVPRPSAGPDGE
jgi:membrane protease YdiL (CAAX protease family)